MLITTPICTLGYMMPFLAVKVKKVIRLLALVVGIIMSLQNEVDK